MSPGLVATIVGLVIASAVIIAAGWIVVKSGVAKGWRENAEVWRESAVGWEARSNELARTVAERDRASQVHAEHYHAEIAKLRSELATALERIAVLEAATDLTSVQAALETNRLALEAHNDEALERHERVVTALDLVVKRLEAEL